MINLWFGRIIVACLPALAFAGIVLAMIAVSFMLGFDNYTHRWNTGPSF